VLGHRRLSIIDLAGGRQPLRNAEGTIWLVCNGEIYNYVELRQKLEARGHRFVTHSDCEVIIGLYEAYGDRLLEHLRGMFAFRAVGLAQAALARGARSSRPKAVLLRRAGAALRVRLGDQSRCSRSIRAFAS
jgi:glucosamine 6-phosphate synthetase-like amidotransferase/phosphosugar isomerase protein